MYNRQGKDSHETKSNVRVNESCFPDGLFWKEIVEVLKADQCPYRAKLTIKKHFLSDMDWPEYQRIVKFVNKPGKPCVIDPRYAGEEYAVFDRWREEIQSQSRRCEVDITLFNDATLLIRIWLQEGDHGDDQGYGVEHDVRVSALFDFYGNVVLPFRPGPITI